MSSLAERAPSARNACASARPHLPPAAPKKARLPPCRRPGLDFQHIHLLAEQIAQPGLDRGVAAAMQHQLGVAPEQPRRIDAQGEVGTDTLAGVAIDHRLRITLNPAAFHLRPRSSLAEHALAPAGAAIGLFAVRAARAARRRRRLRFNGYLRRGGRPDSPPKLKLAGAGSRTVEPRRGGGALIAGGSDRAVCGSAKGRSVLADGATSAWVCSTLGSA